MPRRHDGSSLVPHQRQGQRSPYTDLACSSGSTLLMMGLSLPSCTAQVEADCQGASQRQQQPAPSATRCENIRLPKLPAWVLKGLRTSCALTKECSGGACLSHQHHCPQSPSWDTTTDSYPCMLQGPVRSGQMPQIPAFRAGLAWTVAIAALICSPFGDTMTSR